MKRDCSDTMLASHTVFRLTGAINKLARLFLPASDKVSIAFAASDFIQTEHDTLNLRMELPRPLDCAFEIYRSELNMTSIPFKIDY